MKNPKEEKKKLLHLQGIRGIAVLAVVFFHFFPDFFPNGYLGVDQFFVLSGYLMAMMMSRANCTISDFLYRRVKRILPLYLIVMLLITLTLSSMPLVSFNTNLKSAKSALFLVSNIIYSENAYFEKLGVAMDMYTHTWSLSLEMQFYLIFPVIFFLFQYVGKGGFSLVGLASLVLYNLSCPSEKFNSMFCRTWQFLVGSYIYISTEDKIYEMYTPLEGSSNFPDEANDLETNLALTVLLYVLFSRDVFPGDFGRLASTLLTAVIVEIGQKSIILENRFLVHIGEVSYVWYLVHWPVYAAVKMNNGTSYLSLALLLSLFASIIVHIVVEKQLLKLNFWATANIIFVLYLLSITLVFAVYKINENTNSDELTQHFSSNVMVETNISVFSPIYADQIPINNQHSNFTRTMAAKYNEVNDNNEINQLFPSDCGWIKENIGEEEHCIKKGNGTKHVMVIGNSYAANAEPIIWDECKDYVSVLERVTLPACEPLCNTKVVTKFRCAQSREWLFRMVKERRPDFLIVAVRSIHMMKIEDGTGPFDGNIFKEAISRLQILQNYVKKKIYLLDTMPEFRPGFTDKVDAYFSKGTPLNESASIRIDEKILVGKLRMQRLAALCSICELYDYTPRFFIDGKFRFHDPKTGVRFIAKGHHFTPPGLERVRGLYTQICQQIRVL